MKLSRLSICVFLMLLGVYSVNAQDDLPPLIVQIDYDIYRFDVDSGDLEQLTDDLDIVLTGRGLEISLDGQYLAFQALSPATLQPGGAVNFSVTDTWVLDIETGDLTLVALQPEDAIYIPGGDSRYFRFSEPIWSPNGTRLVWKVSDVVDYPEEEDLLNVLFFYDAETGEIEEVEVSDASMLTNVTDMAWGEFGIAALGTLMDGDGERVIQVYSEDGELLNEFRDPLAYSDYLQLVTMGNQEYIYLRRYDVEALIDPLTGELAPVAGVLGKYDRSEPDSISVFVYDNPNFTGYVSQVSFPDGTPSTVIDSGLISTTLAGDRVAFYIDEAFSQSSTLIPGVYLWEDGYASPIEALDDVEVDSLTWGAQGWRVIPFCQPDTPDDELCHEPAQAAG
jgi:hypothetical protein